MRVRLVPWGGSLLLHATVLIGIMLISNRLQQPLQIELFDFALIPAAQSTVQPVNQDAIITETRPEAPSHPKRRAPPQPPAKPVRPKPHPAVVAKPAIPEEIEAAPPGRAAKRLNPGRRCLLP